MTASHYYGLTSSIYSPVTHDSHSRLVTRHTSHTLVAVSVARTLVTRDLIVTSIRPSDQTGLRERINAVSLIGNGPKQKAHMLHA